MGTEAISSALRLELRPGERVLRDARPHRFESLEKDRARIRDATTGELREVTDAGMPGAGDDTRVLLTYFGAIVFSPITLWGPVLFGCGAYAAALRLWPKRQVERLSA